MWWKRRGIVIEGLVKNVWRDMLDLQPWRRAGEPLQRSYLRVTIRTGKLAVDDVVSVDVTELTANEPPFREGFDAEGASRLRRLRRLDDELAHALARRREPRSHTDANLGTLTLDRAYDWFATQRGAYEVSIKVHDPDHDETCIPALHAGCAAILDAERRLPELADAVTAEMHPLYLERWRGDRYAYTAEDIRARLKLTSIEANGSRTTLRFDIGTLFTDHGIELRLESGEVSEILLA